MMRGKRTQATPKAKQKPTKQEPQTQPKGQRPNPPHLKVFPLYEGETGEKVGCELTMGLNSQRKSIGRVSAQAECNEVAKVIIGCFAGAALFVSRSDSRPGKSVIALPSMPWKSPFSLRNPFN